MDPLKPFTRAVFNGFKWRFHPSWPNDSEPRPTERGNPGASENASIARRGVGNRSSCPTWYPWKATLKGVRLLEDPRYLEQPSRSQPLRLPLRTPSSVIAAATSITVQTGRTTARLHLTIK